MKAKQWPVIGLFAVVLQAGFSLPVMADTNHALPARQSYEIEDGGAAAVCPHLEQLLIVPDSLAWLIDCEFLNLMEESPEAKRLLLARVANQEQPETEAAKAADPPPRPAPAAATTTTDSAGVERWRDLVAAYFAAGDVDRALSVINCESIGGDPNAVNPSSGASGLFQHMPRYWAERSAAAGWSGADIFNPEANIAVAAWLVYSDGWHHWPNCG